MIYFEGLYSIIECTYIKDSIGNKSGECDIFVNPASPYYIAGKLVIINRPDYSSESLKILVQNSNRIISRVIIPPGFPEISFQPYILRVDMDIMWNGREYRKNEFKVDELLDSGWWDFSMESYTLYFPKIYTPGIQVKDPPGNLTALGYASQQVGINVREDTIFTNLDLVKCKKLGWEGLTYL